MIKHEYKYFVFMINKYWVTPSICTDNYSIFIIF